MIIYTSHWGSIRGRPTFIGVANCLLGNIALPPSVVSTLPSAPWERWLFCYRIGIVIGTDSNNNVKQYCQTRLSNNTIKQYYNNKVGQVTSWWPNQKHYMWHARRLRSIVETAPEQHTFPCLSINLRILVAFSELKRDYRFCYRFFQYFEYIWHTFTESQENECCK